jgi:hypothetical protein
MDCLFVASSALGLVYDRCTSSSDLLALVLGFLNCLGKFPSSQQPVTLDQSVFGPELRILRASKS